MTRTPRSEAFKKKVAIEALREDNTLEAIARKYGVHPVQVGKWKKALLDGAEAVLERKVGQLTIELDFLKKNSVIEESGAMSAYRYRAFFSFNRSTVSTIGRTEKQFLLPSNRYFRVQLEGHETNRLLFILNVLFMGGDELPQNSTGKGCRSMQNE